MVVNILFAVHWLTYLMIPWLRALSTQMEKLKFLPYIWCSSFFLGQHESIGLTVNYQALGKHGLVKGKGANLGQSMKVKN